MVYYKGALSYETLKCLPIPEILELQEHARAINEALDREAKRNAKS